MCKGLYTPHTPSRAWAPRLMREFYIKYIPWKFRPWTDSDSLLTLASFCFTPYRSPVSSLHCESMAVFGKLLLGLLLAYRFISPSLCLSNWLESWSVLYCRALSKESDFNVSRNEDIFIFKPLKRRFLGGGGGKNDIEYLVHFFII